MNLVVGNSSQLSKYFPDDYIKISSRNVDLDYLKSNEWDSVYITFAEQRIYDNSTDFVTPNYQYTLSIIESLLDSAKKIACYTSCELWNQATGYIGVDAIPNFYPFGNEYVVSKLLLMNRILERRKTDDRYNKVILLHPFYFNSIHRSNYFLFGKIFDSIVHKKQIQVGSLNFHRDMVHTRFAVEKSITAERDSMIGSGNLYHARTFIQDLYSCHDMDFNYYVQENNSSPSLGIKKLIQAKVDWDYSYDDLLNDTCLDIQQVMRGN